MHKPIIVGVDIRPLRITKTGVKTYLEELYREFKSIDSTEISFRFLDDTIPIYTGNSKILKAFEHFKFHLWKQIILPVKALFNRCDVLFCVDDCVPYVHLGYNTIHVIHDAFCFEMPENYGKLWLKVYKLTSIAGALRAKYVITPTHYSKKQILKYIDLDPDKIVVIPEAPKQLSNTSEISAHQNRPLPTGLEKYILHVGSMFKRKNLPNLVTAFAKVKETDKTGLKLVLAGSVSTNLYDNDHGIVLQLIQAHKLQNEVIITGYLQDTQLNMIYENALMYVFPSVNEGFGLPVLEAFEHDIPVLVANNTCLTEVGADAVLSFNPYDTDEMALQIQKLLSDDLLRHEMIAKGKKRLQDFSWHKTAEEIIGVFKNSF